MGVASRSLPSDSIANAFETGARTVAELGGPLADDEFKLWRVAKNYYYPSFDATVTNWVLHINLGRWQSMSDAQRGRMVEACRQNIDDVKDYDADVDRALDRIKGESVAVRVFPDDALTEARDAALRTTSSGNPAFARAWESYSSFKQSPPCQRYVRNLKRCPT